VAALLTPMIFAIAALFLLIGAGAILAAARHIRRRKQLLQWREVTAVIVEREVVTAKRPGGGAPAFRKEANLTFVEEDSGIRSSAIFPESPISDERTIQRWMERFPERVPVRKDPDDSQRLVLLHGGLGLYYFILGTGCLSLVIGFAILALALIR